MAYGINDWVNQINAAKSGGNNGLAYAMFNGLQKNGQGGALDVALRNAWGEDAAKQWINQGYNDYGAATGFDPTTGKYSIIGKDGPSQGTLAGWDPSQYSATAGSDWLKTNPTLSYTPTVGMAGMPAVGVSGDGKTPMPELGTPVTGAVTGAPGGGAPAATPYGGTPGATPGATPTAAPTGSPFDYFNDEGYKFAKQQGMDGIQTSAAAGGSLNSGATLKALTDYNQGLASQFYGDAYDRWNQQGRNARGDYENDRNYNRGVYQDDRNYNRGVYTDDRNFNEDRYRYDQGFNYNAARDDRDFNENQRRYDQGFNYSASQNDIDRNLNTLKYLTGLGMTGSGQQSGLDTWIADMYGRNTMTGAGAGAGSMTGQASNINNLISQIMQMIMGNQYLNMAKP